MLEILGLKRTADALRDWCGNAVQSESYQNPDAVIFALNQVEKLAHQLAAQAVVAREAIKERNTSNEAS